MVKQKRVTVAQISKNILIIMETQNLIISGDFTGNFGTNTGFFFQSVGCRPAFDGQKLYYN